MASQQTNNTQLYKVSVECNDGSTVQLCVPAETEYQAISRAQRRNNWPDSTQYDESDIKTK